MSTHFPIYFQEALQFPHRYILKCDPASGRCCCAQIGSGHDPVRGNLKFPGAQFPHPLDIKMLCSHTLDLRSHCLQISAQPYNLRFPGTAVNMGFPAGTHCCQYCLLCGSYTGMWKNDFFSHKFPTVCRQICLLLLNLSTQMPQCHQMKIYWPFSDHTASRITDPTTVVPAQHRCQQNHRRAHSSCICSRDLYSVCLCAVQIQVMSLPPGNSSQIFQDLFHAEYIRNPRTSPQNTQPFVHQRCCHHGKRRIF